MDMRVLAERYLSEAAYGMFVRFMVWHVVADESLLPIYVEALRKRCTPGIIYGLGQIFFHTKNPDCSAVLMEIAGSASHSAELRRYAVLALAAADAPRENIWQPVFTSGPTCVEDPRARAFLIGYLGDPDPALRSAALRALSSSLQLADAKGAIATYIVRNWRDTDPDFEYVITKFDVYSEWDRYGPLVARLAEESPSSEVRAWATYALASKAGSPEAQLTWYDDVVRGSQPAEVKAAALRRMSYLGLKDLAMRAELCSIAKRTLLTCSESQVQLAAATELLILAQSANDTLGATAATALEDFVQQCPDKALREHIALLKHYQEAWVAGDEASWNRTLGAVRADGNALLLGPHLDHLANRTPRRR